MQTDSDAARAPAARRTAQRRLALIVGLLLAVLAFPSAPACAQVDPKLEARTTFERGVEASRAQRWEEARTQFKRSLELMPKASTMYNLAVADIKLGLGREALQQLDAFVAAATEEHAAMVERSRVLRPQAVALVESERAAVEHRGKELASSQDDGLSDAARKEVERARDAYARGRDKEALEGFDHAYRLSRRAELLYNVGVVADRMRDDQRAVRSYEMFVAALPDAPEAAVAQVRIEALRASLAEQGESQQTSASRGWQAAPDGRRRDGDGEARDLTLPRTLLTAGPILTVASISVLAFAAHRVSEYNTCLDRGEPASRGGERPCLNPDEVRDEQPLARRGVYASAVLAAVGVAATVVGAVQLSRRKQAARRRVAWRPDLQLGQQAATFTLAGQF